jgi:DNA-binding MarR family transcriptional regulator
MPQQITFDDTVSYMLAKVTTAFRSELERQLGPVGLHGGQVFVLLELWRQDGLRQVDIASRLDVAAPTVNKMLKGLLEINLISIDRADDDRRARRIFLTDMGYAIREDVERQWIELEGECLKPLTAAERLIFYDLLSKIRASYTGRETAEDD